jgi:pimeloyl-ACP methyl ester carboxylesterase
MLGGAMARERFVDSDGVKLHAIDWGGSGRVVVLLAGLGDTAQLYRGLGRRLSGRFRTLGLTRRGHGRSDRPDGGYDLDTLVEDIRCFLDVLKIERSILVGHSFGGLEVSRFAARYPQRTEAVVYLDALFPKLDPEPDLSEDPVWSVVPTGDPAPSDLASRGAYMAYYQRVRPAWARIWCKAIKADIMDRVTVNADGSLNYCHDDELMNHIYRTVWPYRNPEYGQVAAPALAIVPNGDYHPGVPLDAAYDLRQAADEYWRDVLLPWIRQRTETFRHAVPMARIVELDTPHHHLFIAREQDTVEAIEDFLDSQLEPD